MTFIQTNWVFYISVYHPEQPDKECICFTCSNSKDLGYTAYVNFTPGLAQILLNLSQCVTNCIYLRFIQHLCSYVLMTNCHPVVCGLWIWNVFDTDHENISEYKNANNLQRLLKVQHADNYWETIMSPRIIAPIELKVWNKVKPTFRLNQSTHRQQNCCA